MPVKSYRHIDTSSESFYSTYDSDKTQGQSLISFHRTDCLQQMVHNHIKKNRVWPDFQLNEMVYCLTWWHPCPKSAGQQTANSVSQKSWCHVLLESMLCIIFFFSEVVESVLKNNLFVGGRQTDVQVGTSAPGYRCLRSQEPRVRLQITAANYSAGQSARKLPCQAHGHTHTHISWK